LLFAVGGLYYGVSYFNGVPTPTSRTAGVALAGLGFYAVYMLFWRQRQPLAGRSLRRRGFTLIGEERR
jgi:hypothetical protein